MLTLQNGVDSVNDLAACIGEEPVLGGTTYIAAALSAPGVIQQTGTHRRIVFGEVFGRLPRLSPRVQAIHEALAGADIQSEAVGDGRVPIWEKFIFLVALAGFTGASRLPIGPLWADPGIRAQFLDACREVERVARAEGVQIAPDVIERITAYVDGIPGTMRSSLLIDLAQGKRIEVEALHGSVVRRAALAGVPAPIMSTLYAGTEAIRGGGTPTRLRSAYRGSPASGTRNGSTPRNTDAPMRARSSARRDGGPARSAPGAGAPPRRRNGSSAWPWAPRRPANATGLRRRDTQRYERPTERYASIPPATVRTSLTPARASMLAASVDR